MQPVRTVWAGWRAGTLGKEGKLPLASSKQSIGSSLSGTRKACMSRISFGTTSDAERVMHQPTLVSAIDEIFDSLDEGVFEWMARIVMFSRHRWVH